jgi:hypothetical protein
MGCTSGKLNANVLTSCSLEEGAGGVKASASPASPAATPASYSAQYPVEGDPSIMQHKSHGTCRQPVQAALRWRVDRALAERICCYNRHGAEPSGYFVKRGVLKEMMRNQKAKRRVGKDVAVALGLSLGALEGQTVFCDTVTGKPLFVAPRGRTLREFERESCVHGWPSFRDEEVVWEHVRCLAGGEAVSVDGTHLGHNLKDSSGNRYCINLVSVAGVAQ